MLHLLSSARPAGAGLLVLLVVVGFPAEDNALGLNEAGTVVGRMETHGFVYRDVTT